MKLKSKVQRSKCSREMQEVNCKHRQSGKPVRGLFTLKTQKSRALGIRYWCKAGETHGTKNRWGWLKVCTHTFYLLPTKHSAHSFSSLCLWRNWARESLRWEYSAQWVKGKQRGTSEPLAENEGIAEKPVHPHPHPPPPRGPRTPSGNCISASQDTGGLWEK